MKITKVLNDYPKLKSAGSAKVSKTNKNESVLTINKYDQYTGEVIGQKMISISLEEIDSQIKDLQEKIDSLKQLRADIEPVKKAIK